MGCGEGYIFSLKRCGEFCFCLMGCGEGCIFSLKRHGEGCIFSPRGCGEFCFCSLRGCGEDCTHSLRGCGGDGSGGESCINKESGETGFRENMAVTKMRAAAFLNLQ